MENFNKQSLKAAVKVYGPLHSVDKKTDAEVKDAISKDERKFTSEQIDQIYSAILNPETLEPEKPKLFKHIVKAKFRDAADFSKEHKVGDDVSSFDAGRLAALVQNGLVEKVEQD
ncbi:hypothetical protein [Pedobacter sp. Leaf132]|uniref:hypothetical protein n=1 Tax=Pedobacter sp. Leaf132 TaxID=2876557 RepID=UPI001E5F1E99|nr:hypothetical protein [Pedobacter sp. Leaf132]